MAVDPAFLACQPRRALKWEEDENGRVILLRPKFGSGKIGLKLQSWFNVGYYRIRLDDIGTSVWKSFDGETRISEVAEKLRNEFGERIEPAEDRLHRFVAQMTRSRLIEL